MPDPAGLARELGVPEDAVRRALSDLGHAAIAGVPIPDAVLGRLRERLRSRAASPAVAPPMFSAPATHIAAVRPEHRPAPPAFAGGQFAAPAPRSSSQPVSHHPAHAVVPPRMSRPASVFGSATPMATGSPSNGVPRTPHDVGPTAHGAANGNGVANGNGAAPGNGAAAGTSGQPRQSSEARSAALSAGLAAQAAAHDDVAEWRAAGLGVHEDYLIAQCRRHGLTPEDLRRRVDGQSVANRLRNGESVSSVRSRMNHG
jgi:hypothetical protein